MTLQNGKPAASLKTRTGSEMSSLAATDKRENKPARSTPQARWRQRNPIAAWCHSATASAIRRGIIERQPCEVCGDPKTDAHHPEWKTPLFCQWLCRKHHKAAERELKLSGPLKCEAVT
ncbi:hypothetical protein AJ88_27620 [Mesorhizobium amorphae CCBAU 01583]|nr:hypothetical protein AJ88_27620 [Mesorhizobium amorphae CCBAU 01583]